MFLICIYRVSTMKTRVTKWGNSLAVRIPQPIAEKAHLRDGDSVEFTVSSVGKLTLRSLQQVLSLEELVSQINPKNLHDKDPWGKAVGKEIW
jgi:antitoxin MazE